ncbi:hypothetical protein EON66_06040 [archaeon]|nr:MAG: hypothetical protein EON66_06040 [archaeon]
MVVAPWRLPSAVHLVAFSRCRRAAAIPGITGIPGVEHVATDGLNGEDSELRARLGESWEETGDDSGACALACVLACVLPACCLRAPCSHISAPSTLLHARDVWSPISLVRALSPLECRS